MPDGLIAAPDVSCITSFTSTTIENSYDLQKSLGVQASTHGKIGSSTFGVSFSASAGYKSAMSMMSSGKFKVILSSAHCHYYFTKLNRVRPPKLSREVTDWLNRVNETYANKRKLDQGSLQQFVQYFGSHITEEALYGARFTYKHKISSTKKASSKSTEISMSLEAQANFGSLLSLGGGFGMTSAQKEAAQSFQEKVETTTISVGAPPPYNGDAMQWASTVKETPVPVKVSLLPIYNLFNEEFMSSYGYNTNLLREIREGLKQTLRHYCLHLLDTGLDVQCFDKSLVMFPDKVIEQGRDSTITGCSSVSCCIEECYRRSGCYMVSHKAGSNECHIISKYKKYGITVANITGSDLYVLMSKATEYPVNIKNLRYNHRHRSSYQIQTDSRQGYDSQLESLSNICRDFCSLDEMCSSFSVDPGSKYIYNCVTFATHDQSSIIATNENLFSINLFSDEAKSSQRTKINQQRMKFPPLFHNPAEIKNNVKTKIISSNQDCQESCHQDSECFRYQIYGTDKKMCVMTTIGPDTELKAVSGDGWATIYPERQPNGWTNITSMKLSEKLGLWRHPEDKSGNKCASRCSHHTTCQVASWNEETGCSLLLLSVRLSNAESYFLYSEGSTVYIPTLQMKMEVTKINS